MPQTQRELPFIITTYPVDKKIVIDCADVKVAEHIYRAVNSHNELVELLTKAIPFIGHLDSKCACDRCKLGNKIESLLTAQKRRIAMNQLLRPYLMAGQIAYSQISKETGIPEDVCRCEIENAWKVLNPSGNVIFDASKLPWHLIDKKEG